MLSELSIENYILIPALQITFKRGFNAITGETGAGKSILLGALSLILGQRADSQSLLDPTRKCVIEGVFIEAGEAVHDLLKQFDVDDSNSVIVRREIAPNGKSRAFINDTPVQLTQLKELGDRLVDVHSQHSTLYLNEAGFQLSVIDHFAGNDNLQASYRKAFDQYQLLLHQQNELALEDQHQAAEVDFLRFQFDELEKARLMPGEQEQWESELETQLHAEEIKARLHQVAQGLVEGEDNVSATLKSLESLLKQLSGMYLPSVSLHNRLETCAIELADIGHEVASLSEKISYDQARIAELQERLDLIYRLQHKHRVGSVTELCVLRDSFALRLSSIASLADKLAESEKKTKAARQETVRLAEKLTDSRRQSFDAFSQTVIRHLASVGMPQARLTIEHQLLNDLTESGSDRITFLFNANPGSEMRPLSKVASGGELSRLMLAVKTTLANRSLVGTIIFDEIDTGVSGETAARLGKVMQQLSRGVQLIVITHLPQIAAKAATHFMVSKVTIEGQAYSTMTELNENERVEEIATMLGGTSASAEARATAKQLMQ